MRKLTIVCFLMMLLVLVACSKEEEEVSKEEPKSEPEVIEEEQEIDYHYYPFTGIATEEEVDDRAVAVMVSNIDQARPQTGLSKADIVFEMLTESNITRFMAIFQSEQPEVVGPVRSAREYFFSLAKGYDSIYIYSGAATFINDMIKSRGIEHIEGGMYDNDGHLIVRETFRKAPHNMYLQLGAVAEVADEKGYDIKREYESLRFLEEDEALPDDLPYEKGTYAKIDYYGFKPIVEFEYEESTEKYIRFNDGVQTIELESEVPIEVDNIFIVESDHRVIDTDLRRAINIDSGGDATLLHKGKALELEWQNQNGRITPVKDGNVVPFVPGKTWIIFVQTIPESGVAEQVKIGKD